MKYAYLLAKIYHYCKEAEVKSSGFERQLYGKMSLLLLNAEAHAEKPWTAYSESLLTIALASPESERLHGFKPAEICKNQRQRHPIQPAKMVAFPFS